MSEKWEKKFINLNGEELGLVNIDKFTELYKKIIHEVKALQSECQSALNLFASYMIKKYESIVANFIDYLQKNVKFVK